MNYKFKNLIIKITKKLGFENLLNVVDLLYNDHQIGIFCYVYVNFNMQ